MDWPYHDENDAASEPAPTWHCPDDSCECHEADVTEDEHEFSVMLLSPTGERMPGALCRIRYQDRVINEPQPNADGSGWVTAKVPRVPSTVVVEWAPANAPKTPGYPFRSRYYVELSAMHNEAGRQRLHNAGYSALLSVRENVKSFQRAYGYENVSGKLEDINDDLALYHDGASPPITNPDPAGVSGLPPAQGLVKGVPGMQIGRDGKFSIVSSQSNAKVGPSDENGGTFDDPAAEPDQKPEKLVPQAAPGDPPSLGGQSAGQGIVQNTRKLPSIVQAIADMGKDPALDPTATPALFELTLLSTEWTDPKDSSRTMWGFFWIFSDALMWEVPNDATWGGWKGTGVAQPLPLKPHGGVKITDRTRLVRLPCTGEEAQKATDMLLFSQGELLDPSGELLQPASDDDAKVPCLVPTAELFDLSYLQADVRITPQNQTITSLVPNVLTYAEAVAKAFDQGVKKSTFLSGPPKSLGTPGKIWAIAERMDTWVFCKFFNNWAFACINHGFHDKISWDASGKASCHAIQTKGGCHDWLHVDYSQIFSAVAGWCLVKGLNETSATWKRTEVVYRDKDLSRLVRGDLGPVPALRYVGNVKNTAHPPAPP
ncbi:MAG: hypothetical protein ABJE95_14635 [Byssovorax sp.]